MEFLADFSLLQKGGMVIWVIAGLSVLGLAAILWITLRLLAMGAWGGGRAVKAVDAFEATGAHPQGSDGGARLVVVRKAIEARTDPRFSDAASREEAERIARGQILEARRGLRLLDVIATVAPLLGLLGTVLGMIAAFQALQTSGAQADPSVLAGGIWEALLTTAAGMAVAIPAALAHAWFDGVADRMAADLEDLLTRVFLASPARLSQAAE